MARKQTARDPKVPGQSYKGAAKKPATRRMGTKAAAGPIMPLPKLSFSHGLNTQRYATEGEVKGNRY